MKKILFILATVLTIASCNSSGYGKLKGKTPLYEMTVQAENGDDSKVDMTFNIDSDLVDSLKISEDTLEILCNRACLYSDFSVKYPLTWKFKTDSKPMLMLGDDGISVLVTGSAKNTFGVEDNVTTLLKFDSTYQVITDEIVSI